MNLLNFLIRFVYIRNTRHAQQKYINGMGFYGKVPVIVLHTAAIVMFLETLIGGEASTCCQQPAAVICYWSHRLRIRAFHVLEPISRLADVLPVWHAPLLNIIYIYTCRIPRCMSSRDRKSECPPRFEAVLSTRGRPFRWLLPPPRLPASTVPGEGEHGGLLEGLLVSMLNRQDVCEPACLFQHMKITLHPKAVRQIAASIYEQQVSPPIKCFENRNYLCLPRHFPRREVNGFARFFDQRVRLPRLNREGFARRPIG